MRVQPDFHRLSDQIWFQLVREKGARFGLGVYAERIFLTRSGRYYVPVDKERAAVRAVQHTAAGKRLLKRFPVHQTAVMPYKRRTTAPAIGYPSITRRPIRFKSRRAHLIGKQGRLHHPRPSAGSRPGRIMHRSSSAKPQQSWQPNVRQGRAGR